MRFASVCSGIEAASVAWHPLGWEAAWLSEIDPFPCAVLAHHYPTTPNLGDMTKISEADLERNGHVDLLVGGTPCQSFSVAGLRKGMADPRGNLALVFLGLLDRMRPRWVVWENVPGVLSSRGGRDFGAFLGGLAELGYGWSYRVLDAQYFGLAQRRKRVFVVGHLGDWRRAAAVLLERAGLRGDPAPRRETGAGIAEGAVSRDLGRVGGGDDPGANKGAPLVTCPDVAYAVTGGPTGGQFGTGRDAQDTFVTHSLRADGFDASEDGTGRGTPIVPVAYQCHGTNVGEMGTLRKGDGGVTSGVPFVAAYPISLRNASRSDGSTGLGTPGTGVGECGDPSNTLSRNAVEAVAFHVTQDPISGEVSPCVSQGNRQWCGTIGVLSVTGVRRLTPRECCRLQGFPDNYLDIPYRGKPASDGPKYKALGNSMATNVMRWIGERIAEVEAIS